MAGRSRKPAAGRGDVTRRTFLVLAGAATVGRFALPAADDGPGDAAEGSTRRLILAPTRWGPGDANLMWTELDASGEALVRMWVPESAEEAAELEAFAAAAARIDWGRVVVADVPMPGGPPRPRRFELASGTSAKFWEIEAEGSGFRVRFGKVGTAGQSREKAFPSAEDARREMARLVAEKRAKGYVEVSPQPQAQDATRPSPEPASDWTSPDAWRRMFDELAVRVPRGREVARPTPEELDAFEAGMDFRLPASYRAFVSAFGPGEFGSFHAIYAPGAEGPRDMGRAQADFARFAEDLDLVTDRQAQAEPITRMVVFGHDVVPCYFGWDVEDVRDPARHEYAIRKYDPDYQTCPVIASSFAEFIHGYVMAEREDDEPGRKSYSPETRVRSAAAKASRPTPKSPAARPAARPKRSPAEERGHMTAIVAAPDDPAPWLAYADWLDGYKDRLGPLIRLRLGGPEAADPATEARLIAGLAKSWDRGLVAAGLLPAILKRLGDRSQIYTDDEGRVRHIRIAGDLVNARLLEAFAAFPGLKYLEIEDHRLTPEEVEAVARIGSIRELHLHEGPGDQDLEAVSRMLGLEELCVCRCRIRGEGLGRLAALPALATLHLGGPESDDWRLSPDSLARLSEMTALKSLHLGSHGLDGSALAHLAGLGRLEYLGFDENPIRDDDLGRLAGLSELRCLDLSETEITGAGLAYLAPLTKLERLWLGNRRIGDAGLVGIGKLASLRELTIRDDPNEPTVTDEGIAAIAGLSRLVELKFDWTDVGDAALRHLAGLEALESLDLSGNRRVVGPGLAHLGSLPRLRRLRLFNTGVTDAAVPHLLALEGLEELNLGNCQISARARKRILSAFPNADV